jgi:lambda repressor-like predicted transcriptional regulator|tara:strand:- start:134 stop:679 length:546 start_codon:yes stop_codon:yes gene_type:complete
MDFESTANELTKVSEKGLSSVSALCKQQIELEDRVKNLKLELKEAEKKLREISQDLLPSAMQEYNLKTLQTEDGHEITVTDFVSAHITEANRQEAHEWLTSNGFGSIIKNTVTASFGRNEDNHAKDLLAELQSKGMTVTNKVWVEPMTLKSFVKEQTGKGENIPHDLFGVFLGLMAKVRRK